MVATLDELRRRWPDYQSADRHLLYARALEDIGRTDEAIEEYKALAGYYPGAEARVRFGMLLDRVRHRADARRVLSDLLTHMRRAPRYCASCGPNGSASPRGRCGVVDSGW